MCANKSKPIVVDAERIEVSKRLYNTVRSFMDSSTKTIYHWNIGVHLHRTVMFRKYNRWILVADVENGNIVLHCGYFEVVCDIIYDGKLHIHDRGNIIEIDIAHPDAFKYFIVPSEEVPYAAPISVFDLVEKLKIYYTAAAEHMKEHEEEKKLEEEKKEEQKAEEKTQ